MKVDDIEDIYYIIMLKYVFLNCIMFYNTWIHLRALFLVKPRKMVNDQLFWVNGRFMPYESFIWSGQRFDSFLPRTLLEKKKLAIYGHIWPYIGPQAVLKP